MTNTPHTQQHKLEIESASWLYGLPLLNSTISQSAIKPIGTNGLVGGTSAPRVKWRAFREMRKVGQPVANNAIKQIAPSKPFVVQMEGLKIAMQPIFQSHATWKLSCYVRRLRQINLELTKPAFWLARIADLRKSASFNDVDEGAHVTPAPLFESQPARTRPVPLSTGESAAGQNHHIWLTVLRRGNYGLYMVNSPRGTGYQQVCQIPAWICDIYKRRLLPSPMTGLSHGNCYAIPAMPGSCSGLGGLCQSSAFRQGGWRKRNPQLVRQGQKGQMPVTRNFSPALPHLHSFRGDAKALRHKSSAAQAIDDLGNFVHGARY